MGRGEGGVTDPDPHDYVAGLLVVAVLLAVLAVALRGVT